MVTEFRECQHHTGDVELNYVMGPDNGPPLVLVPAQMGTWESYQRVLVPLSSIFQVFSIDLRGHGKSQWATGSYSFAHIGADMSSFLEDVVKRPAIIAGNSSGGLVALWLAANRPHLVSGIVFEDAPLFSAEMPRFRDHDRFVYQGLQHTVDAIGNVKQRNLADYFQGVTLPVQNGRRVRRVPNWFITIMTVIIRRYEARHPGQPVDIRFFPLSLRLLIKSLSTFDPDFARAFVDGRIYHGLDHAEALKRVTCPVLVLHADWFRHPAWGLVGAMDDQDAARVLALVPTAQYKKIPANHVIHFFKPHEFVREIVTFAARLKRQQ